MDRRRHELSKRRGHEPASLPADAELLAEEGLRGGCPQADDYTWAQQLDLGVEPRPARGDLRPARFRVDPAFSPRLPFEVLDSVREVRLAPVDPGVDERLVEQAAPRPDERPKTVCVPVFHRSQTWQPAAASLSVRRVGRSGMRSAVVPGPRPGDPFLLHAFPDAPASDSQVAWTPRSSVVAGCQPSSREARPASTALRCSSPSRAGAYSGGASLAATRRQSS